MVDNPNRDIRRRSTYEPLRKRLYSKPSLSRSTTLPPMDTQQQLQRGQLQQQNAQQDQKNQEQLPMGSNMRVYVRCRSRNQREIDEKSSVVISTLGAKGKEVILSNGPNTLSQYKKTYTFDQVFGAESDQETVFNSVARSYIHEMLQGYNCTVFAYGQTGTGKTYTMSGDIIILGDLESKDKILLGEHAGIIPRVLVDLFKQLTQESNEYSVKISFLELYNERLKDLLAENDEIEEKIRIFDNNNGTQYGKQNSFSSNSHNHGHNNNTTGNNSSSIMVKGMEEIYIKSANEGLKLLMTGSLKRKVAATKCNDLSSRSHTVFTITTNISKTDPVSGEQYIKIGKLNLVDLAGSENINRSGAENKRAQEAGLINKSLLTLGRVINALVDHSQHIPYRESKLTRLLQDSLGGKTKTCIIATISPAKISMDETVSTLEYATRAKSIKNTPQINQSMSKNSCIMEYIHEIDRLRQELKASRQKEGMYITQDQYDLYESNGILVDEQKVRIQNMEEQIKKFKEKYVEQTDLNKESERKLKESESLRNKLQEQKKTILQTFENYQTQCINYVNKVDRIHHRNVELIKDLKIERERIHVTSMHANNMMKETLKIVAIKTNELNKLNADLDSSSITFKKNCGCLLTDMASFTLKRNENIGKELDAIDFRNYVSQIKEMHSGLCHILEKFNENSWTQETKSIYSSHRKQITDYYEMINTYNKSIKNSFIGLLKKIEKRSITNITDMKQAELTNLNELFKIIINQKQSLLQLEQELVENKQALKKSDELLVQLKTYFKERIKVERSNIFYTIKESLENAERRQMSLDDEILQTVIEGVQDTERKTLEVQTSNINKMSNHESNSLGIFKKHLERSSANFHKVSDDKMQQLTSSFPYTLISDSFQKLDKKLFEDFSEKSSEPLLTMTRQLADRISSKSAILSTDMNAVAENTENKIIAGSNKDALHLKNAKRGTVSLQEVISKHTEQFKDMINEQDTLIHHYSDTGRSVTNAIQKSSRVEDVPIPSEPKIDIEGDIILDLPKLNSPQDFKIYEDKYQTLKVEPHSPTAGRLVFCPSTPVPVPDQPLPRVLAPRSINSNTKKCGILPVELTKSQLANSYSNNLKRKLSGIASEYNDQLLVNNQVEKRLHLPEAE